MRHAATEGDDVEQPIVQVKLQIIELGAFNPRTCPLCTGIGDIGLHGEPKETWVRLRGERPQEPPNLLGRSVGPWLPKPECLLRENCRIARNRGFIAGVTVGLFVFTTVLVLLAVLQ